MNLDFLEEAYSNTFKFNDELSNLTEEVTYLACQSKPIFSYYLGMLSYMEFVGARTLLNMIALQSNSSNFSHIIEELNHANTLRNLASKLSGKVVNYEPESILCLNASSSYIIRVIKKTHDLLNQYLDKNDPAFYPTLVGLVSGILERRTIWWYHSIFKALKSTNLDVENQIKPVLDNIMEDEQSHMIFCDKAILKDSLVPQELVSLSLSSEKNFFKRFVLQQLKVLRNKRTYDC